MKRYEDTDIASMDMATIKERLCGKCYGDPLVCFDCESKCVYGNRAVELLELETYPKTMTKKQKMNIEQKITAMENYLEALQAEDTVKFIFETYNCREEKQAKTKLYQWRHNYGSNPNMIAGKIQELKNEIAPFIAAESSMQTQAKQAKEKAKVKEIEKYEEIAKVKEKKASEKQNAAISKNYLEQTRTRLENRILELDDLIAEYEKSIVAFKKEQEESSEQIQSIRKVLEIFQGDV